MTIPARVQQSVNKYICPLQAQHRYTSMASLDEAPVWPYTLGEELKKLEIHREVKA